MNMSSHMPSERTPWFFLSRAALVAKRSFNPMNNMFFAGNWAISVLRLERQREERKIDQQQLPTILWRSMPKAKFCADWGREKLILKMHLCA